MSESALSELQPSAGTLMRKAREDAGLHLGALSASLKVPVKKLEALEADRIDLLPDAVFARALASSVCRSLKIDAEPILAALPQLALPRLGSEDDGVKASFRTNSSSAQRPIWAQLSKPWTIAVLALVIGTLFMALLPFTEKKFVGVPIAPTIGSVSELPVALQKYPTGTVPIRSAEVVVPDIQISPAALVGANGDANAAQDSSVASARHPVSSQPLSAQMPLPASGQDGILMIKTRGPSWVEVTDAGGIVQLRRTMIEGESLGVSGPLPMRVVLGRADMAEVQVRGNKFDLAPASKDNVARFEVR
jgi:cytoskeleton protein RodZ